MKSLHNREALLCYEINEALEILGRRTSLENLSDEHIKEMIAKCYDHMYKLDKRNAILAEQGILIAAAARRCKDVSSDWKYYKDEDLKIMNGKQFEEKMQHNKYLINYTALFSDRGMRYRLDNISNGELDKMISSNDVKFNEFRSVFIDEDSNIKILYRKDAGLGVDDDCKSRYSLSYDDLKNYWTEYQVINSKGGICTETDNLLGCHYVFDYRANVKMVDKYDKLKKLVKEKWYIFKKKCNVSHWFFNCGNACIWSGEYIGTKKGKNRMYKIDINGGYKYKMRFNKIYNIDETVLVIVDSIEAEEGVVFETNHLDEIQNKIENYLLKIMHYIQFRLNNMGKDNVDAIKLVLSNKMIKRNKNHCNNGRCLKSISKEKVNDINRRILCSGCKTIYYCSKRCAKMDWKMHKNICFRNRLSSNKRLSRNKTYLFDWA